MLAVITDPEPNAPVPNGVIEPGALKAPVCWPQGGASGAPREVGETSTTVKNVVPCRYPWDVPFGIIRDFGSGGTVVVQPNGEFEIQYGFDTSNTQLYGKPEIGTRIYYDGTQGQYVCANAISAYGGGAARFPGAATIGYVTRVDGTTVRIKIDPQPPKSQYVMVVHNASSLTLSGGEVVVLPKTDTVAKWTVGTDYCYGVYTGYSYLRTSGGGYNLIICTSGPAWIYPTYTQLYSIRSVANLSNYSPHNARIGADMAIRVVSDAGTVKNIPTLGFLHWDLWYTGTSTNKQSVMVYVDPDPKSSGMINPVPRPEVGATVIVKYEEGIK